MQDIRIAVVIPVYNEDVVIKGTIDALLTADFDRKDIFVINDRSTDNTAKVAESTGVNVFTCEQNGGKAKAQASGLEHFRIIDNYDWVVFLDGDTKVCPGFYTAMYSAAKTDPSVALYVGQVKSAVNNHVYSASRAYEYTFGHDVVKTGQSQFNVIFVSPGCASMYRTDVLKQLQIDHTTLAEDMDLTMQVHRLKHKVKYIEDAAVWTQDPSTFKDYHKQILRWQRGVWQVILKHKVFGFGKKQPVDFYMILLILDVVLCNRLLLVTTLSATTTLSALYSLCLDVGVAFAIALYVYYRTRRFDVIYKFPIYYWMSYVNLYAFVRSFFEIVILRKNILAWNKVARYSFEQGQNLKKV